MIFGRFLLRFLLVPLGAAVAVLVAVLFVMVANWNRFAAVVAQQTNGDELIVALFLAGAWIMFVASISAMAMMLPAALGALFAEAFAVRSWIFHVANGGLSAWIGLNTMVEMHKPYDFYSEPIIAIGAGIAAGFAYWAVAGWNAGFWKPLFAPPPQPLPPGQPLSGAPPRP
jgi:ABC-type amino acid transport substrate-binding protein